MGDTLFFNEKSASNWLLRNGFSEDGASWGTVDCFSIKFSVPKETWKIFDLCRSLSEWCGQYRECLVWIKDWPNYQQELMAIILSMRKGWGTEASLKEMPAQLFKENSSNALGLFMMTLLFGWDAVFLPVPSQVAVVSFAHEGIGIINSKTHEIEFQVRKKLGDLGILDW